MADKRFGVRELIVLGSGTPKIKSPNNLNLDAVNVAISTNITVGGDLDVDGHTELDAVNISGVATATSFVKTGGTSSQYLMADGSTSTGGGGSNQDVFKTIAVSGQSDVVADSATDTLTLAAGANMTITTNAGSDTITFASSGGGGGSAGVSTTAGSFSIGAGSTTNIDSFAYATNDYKVAEYTLQFQNGSNIQAQKLLVMQDGSNVYSNSYGVMASSNLLVSVGSTIGGGNVYVNVTTKVDVSGTTTYRWRREVQE